MFGVIILNDYFQYNYAVNKHDFNVFFFSDSLEFDVSLIFLCKWKNIQIFNGFLIIYHRQPNNDLLLSLPLLYMIRMRSQKSANYL